MASKPTVFGFVTLAIVSAAQAADDQVECKRIVDAYIQAESMFSATSPMVDNARRKAEQIKQMRADGVPECEIQRSSVGTAAQLEDKQRVRR